MKIDVKSNGIEVGYTYDNGGTIKFYDNNEAKRVLAILNTNTKVGISSRSSGNINSDGLVDNISLNEIIIL